MKELQTLSVQIPMELYERLKKEASESLRSINKQIVFCIREQLDATVLIESSR